MDAKEEKVQRCDKNIGHEEKQRATVSQACFLLRATLITFYLTPVDEGVFQQYHISILGFTEKQLD